MARSISDDKPKSYAFGWEVGYYPFTKPVTDRPKDFSYTSHEERSLSAFFATLLSSRFQVHAHPSTA
jgi:hypothetical protein